MSLVESLHVIFLEILDEGINYSLVSDFAVLLFITSNSIEILIIILESLRK
jgi:hypothetical protein